MERDLAFEETVVRYSPYLEFFDIDKKVRYLGYLMSLTASEYEILFALVKSGGFHDKSSICELLGKETKSTHKSVAVHISAINRKAVEIGGRKIITTDRKKGYSVAEYV